MIDLQNPSSNEPLDTTPVMWMNSNTRLIGLYILDQTLSNANMGVALFWPANLH